MNPNDIRCAVARSMDPDLATVKVRCLASIDVTAIITFAYGSNMPTARITDQTRCPSAKAMGRAELRGYELRWHKVSNDGSAKADIVKTDVAGASVFGVLYEILLEEKPALDRAEGLGHGYEEIQIVVLHKGAEATVTAYKATNIDPKLQP